MQAGFRLEVHLVGVIQNGLETVPVLNCKSGQRREEGLVRAQISAEFKFKYCTGENKGVTFVCSVLVVEGPYEINQHHKNVYLSVS